MKMSNVFYYIVSLLVAFGAFLFLLYVFDLFPSSSYSVSSDLNAVELMELINIEEVNL